MLHSLAFLLSRGEELPEEGVDWQALVAAQGHQGPDRGRGLRLFRMPDQWQGSLDELVASGSATIAGEDPLGSAPERRSLICDAVVTQFDVPSLWIGVYAVRGPRRRLLAAGAAGGAAGSLPPG